jgi:hypothetical protein
MKKSDINQPPCYFDKYINCLDDITLAEAFRQSRAALEELNLAELNQISSNVYAPGKWTVKAIFQHLIDTEHILAYRALRIGRNDRTRLTGFDEGVLAAHVNAEGRSLESLVDELKLRRQVTKLMFDSFTEEALQRSGVASEIRMSSLAFGFAINGHQAYHLKIIEEKYLPLIVK